MIESRQSSVTDKASHTTNAPRADQMPLQDPKALAPGTRALALIVATAFFMENLDLTVIATALPQMAEAFATTPVALSLGLTSYILALAIVLPASGWIADRWGARRVFMLAILGFTLASILCSVSTSLTQFVCARSLQGLSGAMMSPVGRLVFLRLTDKKDLVRGMNFITAPGLIGTLIGPPLGGLIASYGDWRWIFWLNVPIGLIGLLLVRRFIPDLKPEGARAFDGLGFCLNGLGLGCLLFGVDLLGHAQGLRLVGAGLALLGLALGWLAMRHYRRVDKPLVDLSALSIPTFAAATFQGGSLFRMSIAVPIFVLPLFLQIGLGLSAFETGVLILAHTFGDVGIKAITTWMMKRFGFRTILIFSGFGFGLFIAAFVGVDQKTPLGLIVFLLLASGAVRSLQLTALAALQFADVPKEQMTGAATYSSINQHVTRALGIALSALLLNLSAAWRDLAHPVVELVDFTPAFLAGALLAACAGVRYLALPGTAGQHVSQGRES